MNFSTSSETDWAVTAKQTPRKPDYAVQQLRKIQTQLEGLRQDLEVDPDVERQGNDMSLLLLAKAILRFRRGRDAIFHGHLFGEPAWDMLLELISAELSSQKVSVSGLCATSGVPSTTALRCLRSLEDGGWLRREPDEGDRRRFWIMLTPKASEVMRNYLAKFRMTPS